MTLPDVAEVRRRRDALAARIAAAGGDPERVTVVAVTKGFGPEAARLALAAGMTDLGENYAQELAAKAAALAADPADPSRVRPRWHFIGRLQHNKVRAIASEVALWQSVDRVSLVDELAARAPGAAILVQVNAAGEEQKGGCPPGEVAGVVQRARAAGLDVRGLMTVAPAGDLQAARHAFRLVRSVADALGLPERSMGMTGDLDVAVAEGSTMVRVGTALFGPRPIRV